MLTQYHRQITTEVLSPSFTPEAIATALAANLKLDELRGQLFHPEYHVDNDVCKGYAFMQAQEQAALQALSAGQDVAGLEALGRTVHTAQDIYSHTNYVRLWLADHGGVSQADPRAIPPLIDYRTRPDIRTGRASIRSCPWLFVPVAWKWLDRVFSAPADSHYVMNIDGPHRGPEFAYVLEAATRHTGMIVERVLTCVKAARPGQTLPYLKAGA